MTCFFKARDAKTRQLIFSVRFPVRVCALLLAKIYILASMFVGRVCSLPKFDLGKYVRWSCLFVTCQNYHFGKYVGWSRLLLAKIYILASMFVGRVCYLPKFTFWQVCWLVVFVTFGKYVGWSCLFVCLYGNFTKSQERLSQSSPNLVTSKH